MIKIKLMEDPSLALTTRIRTGQLNVLRLGHPHPF